MFGPSGARARARHRRSVYERANCHPPAVRGHEQTIIRGKKGLAAKVVADVEFSELLPGVHRPDGGREQARRHEHRSPFVEHDLTSRCVRIRRRWRFPTIRTGWNCVHFLGHGGAILELQCENSFPISLPPHANEPVVAADREQLAVVGESHWTVTDGGGIALGDGTQLPDQLSCFSRPDTDSAVDIHHRGYAAVGGQRDSLLGAKSCRHSTPCRGDTKAAARLQRFFDFDYAVHRQLARLKSDVVAAGRTEPAVNSNEVGERPVAADGRDLFQERGVALLVTKAQRPGVARAFNAAGSEVVFVRRADVDAGILLRRV